VRAGFCRVARITPTSTFPALTPTKKSGATAFDLLEAGAHQLLNQFRGEWFFLGEANCCTGGAIVCQVFAVRLENVSMHDVEGKMALCSTKANCPSPAIPKERSAAAKAFFHARRNGFDGSAKGLKGFSNRLWQGREVIFYGLEGSLHRIALPKGTNAVGESFLGL
jgi:hypothetical protein